MSDALVSIIITNYNYEAYVGQAIESALALDWPAVEIIVVDDGSTDGSRVVIERYIPRGISAYFISNCGHSGSAEFGYNACRGDLVLFLDSDDLIAPSIVREAMLADVSGVSKYQYQMNVIDADGKPSGQVIPKFRSDISPEKITRWASRTGSYPSPPNSGNLLTREFLTKIFPLEPGMDRSIDSYCQSTAPLLGRVVSIAKPLIWYRVHGRNMGALSELDVSRIAFDLKRHFARCAYASRIAARFGIAVDPECCRFGFYNLAMRIASLRLAWAQHPLPRDSRWRCVADGCVSLTRAQGLSPFLHLGMFCWFLAVAFAPKWVARRFVSWRFVPTSRPRFLRRLLRAV